MLKSYRLLKISLLPLWMRISTPQMVLQLSLKWPKWINSGNYDASVKEALAAMLEVFELFFVEEVLEVEIEALNSKTSRSACQS